MNTALLPTMAATAGLNTLGVLSVFFLHRTRPKAAYLLAVTLPILVAVLLCLTPRSEESSHSLGQFAVVICSIATVWLPGAIIGLVAARQSGRLRLIGAVASATLAAGFGALLMLFALAFSCYLLGECL